MNLGFRMKVRFQWVIGYGLKVYMVVRGEGVACLYVDDMVLEL